MFIVDDARRTPPPPLALETLLRDVAAYRDLPLRATAYAFRDVDPKLVKIVVVVEPTEATTTLTSAAFALINLQGQAAAQWTEEGAILTARPVLSGASVPPGDYRLRVVAVDAAQRRGAVDYEFAARLTGGAPVTFGSLMVGSNEQGRFRARLLFEPGVETLTGYTEFYGTLPSGSSVTAKFEIADSADGPALSSAAGVIQATSVRLPIHRHGRRFRCPNRAGGPPAESGNFSKRQICGTNPQNIPQEELAFHASGVYFARYWTIPTLGASTSHHVLSLQFATRRQESCDA